MRSSRNEKQNDQVVENEGSAFGRTPAVDPGLKLLMQRLLIDDPVDALRRRSLELLRFRAVSYRGTHYSVYDDADDASYALPVALDESGRLRANGCDCEPTLARRMAGFCEHRVAVNLDLIDLHVEEEGRVS